MLSKEKIGNNAGKPFTSAICICEGNFVVKNMVANDDRIQAFRLRHRVFSQELQWVPEAENALEADYYDNNATFFGVFDHRNRLCAFLRLLMPEGSFMLEKEFSSLRGLEHKLRKEKDTAEASRLCVAPETRNDKVISNYGIHDVSMFLYKGVYQWCIKNCIRYLYLVVEQKVYRLLQAKGFPCTLIGTPKEMSDGVIALGAIMDWRAFETLNAIQRPGILRWFSQSRVNPVLWRLKQPEPYSPPRASA